MQIRDLMAGEGASTPHFIPAELSPRSVMICPMPGAGLLLTPEMVNEIYRIAKEWAVRAQRPSLYEQALQVCEN